MSRVLKVRRLVRGFRRKAKSALGFDRSVHVAQMVSDYRDYWSRAAAELGATFSDLSDDLWEIELNGRRTWINNSFVQLDDPVRLVAAADKPLCYELADRASVPLSEHLVFTLESLSEARSFIGSNGGPFVVKPARGTSGAGGVTTGVDARALASAAVLASTYDHRLIIERMIHGETYRLLFLDGELLHVVRRRGVRVLGDGHSSVARLLHRAEYARAEDDDVIVGTLRRQGIGLAVIPEPGAEVLVRGVPTSTGSREPRTVYDEVVTDLPSEVVTSVSKVVAALDLEFAGVDIVSADPSRWGDPAGGVFLEVNGTPALHHHVVPASPRDGLALTVRVLDRLLRAG